jgi:hypothetical protein
VFPSYLDESDIPDEDDADADVRSFRETTAAFMPFMG